MNRRRTRGNRIVLAAALAMLGNGGGIAEAQQAVNLNLPATHVYVRDVTLKPGYVYNWRTSGLGGNADPVLHLWDPNPLLVTGAVALEVAQDDNGAGGANASLTFAPAWPIEKTLKLVMRAAVTDKQGTATITQTTTPPPGAGDVTAVTLAAGVSVGGALVQIPGGQYTYETAMAPNGALDPLLIVLDSDKQILFIDDDSGVGLGARQVLPAGGAFALVGTAVPGDAGAVHLYANDWFDSDLDGLGDGLETQLGTCAADCEGVFNSRDTDRDGLPDGMEVFGFDDPEAPQYLSRWGADPLHKDVFIEMDYHSDLEAVPWSESDAQLAQVFFNAGAAADLGNPDGQPGVNLHFDTGQDYADPALATLIGDWGGVTKVPVEVNYRDAADQDRHPSRRGIFRYAMSRGSGGGQAPVAGDRMQWGNNGNQQNKVRLFLHELGHMLGLQHYGHASVGRIECKPNYKSLMNYALMDQPDTEFSQGDREGALDPSMVDETRGLNGSDDPAYLAQADFHRRVASGGVDYDFSRNNVQSARAPLNFTTNFGRGGCRVSDKNVQALSIGQSRSTPSIARAFGRMYVFWVTENQEVRYRSAVMSGPDDNGSCPGGDRLGDTCTVWTEGGIVKTERPAYAVAVHGWDDGLVLVYTNETGVVHELRAPEIAVKDRPAWEGEQAVPTAIAIREPELVRMRVDPMRFAANDEILALFHLADLGRFKWHTLSSLNGSWTSQGTADLRLEDSRGDVRGLIEGTQSPTLANWPPFGTSADNAVTCGAFTHRGALEVFCYDRREHRFAQVRNAFRKGGTTERPPTITAKPGFVFRTLRDGKGQPQNGDATRGQFWLTTIEQNPARVPWIWISSVYSAKTQPATMSFDIERRALMRNKWGALQPATGAALYSDVELSAIKGAYWQEGLGKPDEIQDLIRPRPAKLQFLPLADGTFQADLRDVNDFQIMSRGICLGLHGAFPETFCGPPESNPAGY